VRKRRFSIEQITFMARIAEHRFAA